MRSVSIIFIFIFLFFKVKSQNSINQILISNGNSVSSAVPFLLISPDSRSNSLGDAGVSTQPDGFSSFWNPAKLAEIKEDYGIGIGFVPWLKNIDPNIYLASVYGFKKLERKTSIGFGVLYFNLGETTFKDESGYQNGIGYPNEFCLQATFSQRVGRYFSLGLNGKYIHSDLTNGQFYQGNVIKPGNSVAIDFGFFFKREFELHNPSHFYLGLDLSNFGPKMSYDLKNTSLLPTNLRMGISFGKTFNDKHYTNFSLEFNKLLVPTLPITDSNGNIILGKDPDRTLLSSVFGSFTDAPGGFREELEEISISPGFEYVYDNIISLRTGLHLENKNFGNKKLLSFGIGIKIESFLDVNFSYTESLISLSNLNNNYTISLTAGL